RGSARVNGTHQRGPALPRNPECHDEEDEPVRGIGARRPFTREPRHDSAVEDRQCACRAGDQRQLHHQALRRRNALMSPRSPVPTSAIVPGSGFEETSPGPKPPFNPPPPPIGPLTDPPDPPPISGNGVWCSPSPEPGFGVADAM